MMNCGYSDGCYYCLVFLLKLNDKLTAPVTFRIAHITGCIDLDQTQLQCTLHTFP